MSEKVLRDIIASILSDFHRASAGTEAHPDDVESAVDEIMRAVTEEMSAGSRTDNQD